MLIVCQGWRVEEGRLDNIEDYDLDFQSKYESLTFPTEGGGERVTGGGVRGGGLGGRESTFIERE